MNNIFLIDFNIKDSIQSILEYSDLRFVEVNKDIFREDQGFILNLNLKYLRGVNFRSI